MMLSRQLRVKLSASETRRILKIAAATKRPAAIHTNHDRLIRTESGNAYSRIGCTAIGSAYFHLYGIEREDVEYILSTFTNTGLAPESNRQAQQYLWEQNSPGALILDAFAQLQRI